MGLSVHDPIMHRESSVYILCVYLFLCIPVCMLRSLTGPDTEASLFSPIFLLFRGWENWVGDLDYPLYVVPLGSCSRKAGGGRCQSLQAEEGWLSKQSQAGTRRVRPWTAPGYTLKLLMAQACLFCLLAASLFNHRCSKIPEAEYLIMRWLCSSQFQRL